MYASRVLPPPLPFATDKHSPGPGSGLVYSAPAQPKPDALLEHRIMTSRGQDESPVSSNIRNPPLSPLRTASRSNEGEGAASPRSSDDDRSIASGTIGIKRKRAHASSSSQDQNLRSAVANNGASSNSIDRLSSISEDALAAKQVESPSQICLCQPDPKVPRPRNAFILYRQHHQAKVVAENPGLANPEISKIIGDLWRQSPAEVKQHWKKLAEEEKLRHQRQYPDYRYQPKRGRNSVPTAIPPGQASPRCLKCGGKTMATPSLASLSSRSATAKQPGPTPADGPMSPHGSASMIPRTPYGIPPGYASSPGLPPPAAAYFQRGLPNIRPPDHSPGPESPDTKRRRFEASGGRYPPRSNGMMPNTPLTPAEHRLPRPEFMKPGPAFVMAPAPPARAHYHQHSISHGHLSSGSSVGGGSGGGGGGGGGGGASGGGNGGLRQSQDTPRGENLKLAPLQHHRANSESSQGQAKSVEAMIMSIKPLAKIKTLAKISSPLQRPGPGSPAFPVRGAVIAVEGTDFAAMEAIGHHVRANLERNGEHAVRAWESPQLECFHELSQPTLLDILQLMTHWHGISSEIIKYITRPPEKVESQPVSPTSPGSEWPKRATGQEHGYGYNTGVERGQIMDHWDARPSGRNTPESPSGYGKRRSLNPTPVALIPNYQLTTTDDAASRIPIADYYSPIDHWQWVAALWRGTVGPDVIICVRSMSDVADGTGGGSGSGAGGTKEGLGNMSATVGKSNKCAVEVRLEEARTVIVRCEKKGDVSEQVLRRVAFEVGEWLRGREDRER